jgi:ABC-type molybdenum transport system ATPase subunit/photorepair protein PhrA
MMSFRAKLSRFVPSKSLLLRASEMIFCLKHFLFGLEPVVEFRTGLITSLDEDVTCTFLEGRRYAITGPNGAGKSTLMRILASDLEPAKGTVTRPNISAPRSQILFFQAQLSPI